MYGYACPASRDTRPARRNRRGEGAQLRDEIVTAAVELLDEDRRRVARSRCARSPGGSGSRRPRSTAHFADQPAIMLAVVQQAFDELNAELYARAGRRGRRTPRTRLFAVCHAYLDFAAGASGALPHDVRRPVDADLEDSSITEADLRRHWAQAAWTLLVDVLGGCVAGGIATSDRPLRRRGRVVARPARTGSPACGDAQLPVAGGHRGTPHRRAGAPDRRLSRAAVRQAEEMAAVRYAQVHGLRMAYREVGRGDPVVFLHGNPTSSYLWRDVLGRVEHRGRCLAPDLVGMGASDKLPGAGPGSYRYVDHRRHLDALLDELGVREPGRPRRPRLGRCAGDRLGPPPPRRGAGASPIWRPSSPRCRGRDRTHPIPPCSVRCAVRTENVWCSPRTSSSRRCCRRGPCAD